MSELTIIATQTVKLGRCYNKYNYILISDHKPTVEECKELCGFGNFNNGDIDECSLKAGKWITVYSYSRDSGDWYYGKKKSPHCNGATVENPENKISRTAFIVRCKRLKIPVFDAGRMAIQQMHDLRESTLSKYKEYEI